MTTACDVTLPSATPGAVQDDLSTSLSEIRQYISLAYPRVAEHTTDDIAALDIPVIVAYCPPGPFKVHLHTAFVRGASVNKAYRNYRGSINSRRRKFEKAGKTELKMETIGYVGYSVM